MDSILPLAGLRARQERCRDSACSRSRTRTASSVANVVRGSAAAAAGVKVGDYLISVGDIPVEDQQFGARLRAKYGASVEGSPLVIKVRRGTETLTLAWGSCNLRPVRWSSRRIRRQRRRP